METSPSSTSIMYCEKSTARLPPSSNVKMLGKNISGGSFTEITVISKISEFISSPSLTVTVICEVPK